MGLPGAAVAEHDHRLAGVEIAAGRQRGKLTGVDGRRGSALPENRMLVRFDIDCGELVRGHRFIARGVCDRGTLEHYDGTTSPGVSLEYELVPGINLEEDERGPFRYLVGVEYEADVPLPWPVNDSGAIAPAVGGPSTHGSRGDWPLPDGARMLRFELRGVDDATGFPHETADGVLVVDLDQLHARWEPVT